MSTRTQQATTVDLIIQPPRVRMHLDRLAMNRPVELRLNPIKQQIEQIKKEGAPKLPEKPEKDAEQRVKDAYKEAQKEYSKFSSDEYDRIVTLYDLCKKLRKISTIQKQQDELNQDGKDLTKKQLAELTKEQKVVADQPADGQDESDYVSLGYADYTDGVDVTSEAEVNALLNSLVDGNPDVQLLFDRDAVSKEKTRYQDSAPIALATCVQMACREFIVHGMGRTLGENKRIMLPDHCVSEGLDNCSLYPLFRTLPSFCLIAERQERRSVYDREYSAWKAENKRKNRAKGNARRKGVKKDTTPTTPFETWEEREVDAEYAREIEIVTDSGDTKNKVLWIGIDDFSKVETDDDDETDGDDTARKFGFDFYINLLCKDVKETMFKDTEIENHADYKDIRVSTDIKRFLSNLIKEFIHRVAPQIRLMMNLKDAKTVSYEIVEFVLRSFIMDSYVPDENGVVTLNEDHENLFAEMARRRDLYAEKQKNKKSGNTTPSTDAEEETVEETAEEEEEEEVAPAPKKTRAKTRNKKTRAKTRNKK